MTLEMIISYIASGLIGLALLLLKRSLDMNDLRTAKLENDMAVLNNANHTQDLAISALQGKLDTMIEILKRVESNVDLLRGSSKS
jgi:ACT domain-containing protein